MTFLLDTNLVSELRKRRPDAGVAAWWADAPASRLYLSALTVGELHRGVERIRVRGDHAQAEALAGWLAGIVRQFADRILPVDAEVAEVWGRLPRDQPVPAVDGLIAATAIRHDLTLVTRNARDVARTGVRLVDPFEG
ncbi:type II toxin-antitoxin system VapC family toxin [Jiangella gansuensis]|uniref:type II toxin-antitoxin system VapC family toxin n=1 Tax=Jiangella gansuensis TaxID=281473 RepID=UPI000478FEF2|nr:type II toxin-antitoxin system VapC family toxin [Jiangella gansuensis]